MGNTGWSPFLSLELENDFRRDLPSEAVSLPAPMRAFSV